MDTLLLSLLLGIGFFVIFFSGVLARVLKAKRYKVYWVVFPWLLSVVAVIAANIFQLDGLYSLGIGLAVFMLLFKWISGLEFLSAVSVTIASFAMMGLLFAGSIFALDKSGSQTDQLVSTVLVLAPESEFYDLSFLEPVEEEPESLIDESVVGYSEADLLPSTTVKKEDQVLLAKAFYEVNPRNANTMRGERIRLLKHDGDIVKGSIVALEGNKLIVGKYVQSKGMIKAPIPLASIKKLEVYR